MLNVLKVLGRYAVCLREALCSENKRVEFVAAIGADILSLCQIREWERFHLVVTKPPAENRIASLLPCACGEIQPVFPNVQSPQFAGPDLGKSRNRLWREDW